MSTVEVHSRAADGNERGRRSGPGTWQPPSSRPAEAGTRSEVHPPLSASLCSDPGNDLLCAMVGGRRAWAVLKAGRGRVAVVVVGVTPHQGARERLVQGQGPQGLAVQTLGVQRGETSWLTHIANWNICGSWPRPSQPSGLASCCRSGDTTPSSRWAGRRFAPTQGVGRPAWMGTRRKTWLSTSCTTWPLILPPDTPGPSRCDAPTTPNGGSPVRGAV